MMSLLLYALAAMLILAGLAGAIVPAVPGIPLIFGGIWLTAAVDHYRHLGPGWLVGIAVIGMIGLTADLLAGALGAKRVGASRQAVWGAFAGTLLGLMFGLPAVRRRLVVEPRSLTRGRGAARQRIRPRRGSQEKPGEYR
ncbi:MAG: DUF456 family protein [Steroidobacteraceae bacterium]